MPHGGYDEENFIAELEIVKIVMEEGKRKVAKDFIGGGLNIELKLEGGEGVVLWKNHVCCSY